MDTRPRAVTAFLPVLRRPRLPRLRAWMAAMAAALVLGGCASGGGINKVVNHALETIGIKDAGAGSAERKLPLRLYAGDNLNSGNDGRALAAVVKIYHLRSANRFERAPFDAFLDEAAEPHARGPSLPP